MHIEQEPVPPSQVLPVVDAATERIIMRLLAKAQEDRYADAHHLLDDLKALQRHIAQPLRIPDASRSTRDRGKPSSSTSSSLWALRAAAFGRMVARVYAGGGAPVELVTDLEMMWQLVAEATRVEAGVAAQVRGIQSLERRGREFRGQAGRKIEELSRAERRLRRSMAKIRAEIEDFERQRREIDDDLSKADATYSLFASAAQPDIACIREAAEKAGSARAGLTRVASELTRKKERMAQMSDEVERLERQIHQYRERLAEQTDAFDAQLRQARTKLAQRAGDTDTHMVELERVASALKQQLEPRPECVTLFEELHKLEDPAPKAPAQAV